LVQIMIFYKLAWASFTSHAQSMCPHKVP
jgi:hypothetical protein